MHDDHDQSPDRRKDDRFKGVLVEYSVLRYTLDKQEDLVMKPAFIQDISLNGLCIFSYEYINEDATLHLKIYPANYIKPVQAQGKVIWQKESTYLTSKNNIHYDVGINITYMDDENTIKYENVITYFAEQQREKDEDIREL